MEYRKLGRTGVEVSSLCLGCMNFGRKTDLEDSCTIINRFIEAGGNFVDTANVYSRGESERVTGEAIKRHGKRDEVVLATKVHGRMKDGDHQPNRFGNSRRMIIEECHHSLERLQTDYIDLYQIHRPQSDVPIDETLRAMDDLVRQGKVRYIGTSTFAAYQCVESQWVSKELGLNRFVTEQPPYHLLDRRVERELIPMAQAYGYGIIPWSPLASGILTGKYKRDGSAPEGSRLEPGNGRHDKLMENDKAFDLIEALTKMAEEKGKSVSQVALAWVRTRPGVTAPIIGPRTLDQLEDNLGCLGVTFSEEDEAKIDEIAPPGRATMPYYEADFGPATHKSIT